MDNSSKPLTDSDAANTALRAAPKTNAPLQIRSRQFRVNSLAIVEPSGVLCMWGVSFNLRIHDMDSKLKLNVQSEHGDDFNDEA